MLRRFVPAALACTMLVASIPSPAAAMSTAQEIELGKATDKQITEQSGVVADPLLNSWVNDVSQRLWAETARKDVPYNIKILDSSDINAFTTYGGYVYIYAGTLDFAQSDDELAGVIGHETGHGERRHTVTLQAKAQALSLLFGLASLFSPIVYHFGQLAEAGLVAKQQRADELQADQYGVMLMTRAGYDPDAMVSFMQHLGALHDEHAGTVDKYFADHPGVPDRINHLLGYAQLDPTRRTTNDILVQGLHDLDTARYSIAARKFAHVLKLDPNNPSALLNLGRAQLAIGQDSKGEQTLAEAAAQGNIETRTAALSRLAALRDGERRSINLLHPNLQPLRDQVAAAQTNEVLVAAQLASRSEGGRDQLKALQSRLQSVSYGMPDLSRLPVRKGSRLDAIVKNLNAMSRYVDTSLSKSSLALNGVGSLEHNKESGVLRENIDILNELAEPLKIDPVPPQSLATLPSYPRMLADLSATNADSVRAVDAARASLAMLDGGLGDLDKFLKELPHAQLDFGGDMKMVDYNRVMPMMQTASDSLAKAAVAAGQAAQLFNLARARQLQTRITMLGLNYPQDRYATLQHALNVHVKNSGLDYDTMLHDDLTPGEVASAAIVAADTNTTPQSIVAEAKSSNRSIIEVANARGMNAEALEIFLGLTWLSYTDDPDKEAHETTTPSMSTTPTIGFTR